VAKFKKLAGYSGPAGYKVRPLKEVAMSETFWRGFVDGLAPEHYLLERWVCPHAGRIDTVRSSWSAVGKHLNKALGDISVSYGRLAEGNRIRPGDTVHVGDAGDTDDASQPGLFGWLESTRRDTAG
jgi:hypothetical protein